MPTYQSFNFFNVTDLIQTANQYKEAEGYYKDSIDDIHFIKVSHSPEKQYSVFINDIEIGEDFTFSEAWGIIKQCIEDVEAF